MLQRLTVAIYKCYKLNGLRQQAAYIHINAKKTLLIKSLHVKAFLAERPIENVPEISFLGEGRNVAKM